MNKDFLEIQRLMKSSGSTLREALFVAAGVITLTGAYQPSKDGSITINDLNVLKGKNAGDVPTKVTILQATKDFVNTKSGAAWTAGQAMLVWE